MHASPHFYSFGRVNGATSPLQIIAQCPVDLGVTDPDGFTISAATFTDGVEEFLTAIPDELYYIVYDEDSQADPSPMVTAPTLKTGDYHIEVTPRPDAVPTNVYTLQVVVGGTTISLAQNATVSDIPPLGYGFHSDGQSVSQFIPVAIEVKPGSSPPTINLRSHGNVPVAILSSTTFDATHILDLSTVTVSGATILLKPNGAQMVAVGDVNGDGLPDVTVWVSTQALQLSPSSTQIVLNAKAFGGIEVKGSQSIKIVPSEQ